MRHGPYEIEKTKNRNWFELVNTKKRYFKLGIKLILFTKSSQASPQPICLTFERLFDWPFYSAEVQLEKSSEKEHEKYEMRHTFAIRTLILGDKEFL